MTMESWWVRSAALIGAAATVLAAGLMWLVLTRPVALAQAFSLGQ